MIFSPCPLLVSRYRVGAVDFDGTNDYLSKSGLTGAAVTNKFSLVFWINLQGETNHTGTVISVSDAGSGSSAFRVFLNAGALQVIGLNSSDATILSATDGSDLTTSGWQCVMMSLDLSDTAKRFVYVGDSARSFTWTTYTSANIDTTDSKSYYVGAFAGTSLPGGLKLNAALGEVWLALGTYTDFSVEANRRKFYSSTGKPVSLGGNGSVPNGTAAIVYLRLNPNQVTSGYATNRGTGGNFTVTGALTAVTSPSD
jgi:hypothetical protein